VRTYSQAWRTLASTLGAYYQPINVIYNPYHCRDDNVLLRSSVALRALVKTLAASHPRFHSLIKTQLIGLLRTGDQHVAKASIYTGQHNTETSRQTSMPWARFEPTIPITMRPISTPFRPRGHRYQHDNGFQAVVTYLFFIYSLIYLSMLYELLYCRISTDDHGEMRREPFVLRFCSTVGRSYVEDAWKVSFIMQRVSL
jgi:hypothetical protein